MFWGLQVVSFAHASPSTPGIHSCSPVAGSFGYWLLASNPATKLCKTTIHTAKTIHISLVFKLSPFYSNDELSSGYFPGVWVLKADVSVHSVGSIFNRWWSVCEDWLVPLPLPRPHFWLAQTTFQLILFPYKYGLNTSQSSLRLHHLLKMEPTQCSETSAFNTWTAGKYPEDNLSSILLFITILLVKYVPSLCFSLADITSLISNLKVSRHCHICICYFTLNISYTICKNACVSWPNNA